MDALTRSIILLPRAEWGAQYLRALGVRDVADRVDGSVVSASHRGPDGHPREVVGLLDEPWRARQADLSRIADAAQPLDYLIAAEAATALAATDAWCREALADALAADQGAKANGRPDVYTSERTKERRCAAARAARAAGQLEFAGWGWATC